MRNVVIHPLNRTSAWEAWEENGRGAKFFMYGDSREELIERLVLRIKDTKAYGVRVEGQHCHLKFTKTRNLKNGFNVALEKDGRSVKLYVGADGDWTIEELLIKINDTSIKCGRPYIRCY